MQSSSFFQAEHIQLVQRVFKRVLSNEWFDRTHLNEQGLAKFVAHCFQKGVKDEEDLWNVAASTAKIRWSRSPDMASWPIKPIARWAQPVIGKGHIDKLVFTEISKIIAV
jgi:hypothetical protein